MRVAFLTPLPPAKTGIAHYASMLLPALARRVEVTAVATDGMGDREAGYRIIPYAEYHRSDFDAVLYQLGNNPFHEAIYREAMEWPGVAVLHDAILHHLIVEMTLARGDAEAYIDAMGRNHGDPGRAWATARAAGLHGEIGNFLFPASVEVANRSRAVVVHNHYAAGWLQRLGVTTPVHVVPHPSVDEPVLGGRAGTRARLGIAADERVIGLFGFLTSAKRGEVVVEAFRRARTQRPGLRLLVVGEAAPNIDVASLASEGAIVTGYAPDEEFGAYYEAADLLVNLRYPSAGESSGTMIRALAAGKPVAVSDYAQFAELPDDCVTKIAFGSREIDALAAFMVADHDVRAIAAAQRRWLRENATLEQTVDAYMRVLNGGDAPIVAAAATRALPLFPQLVVTAIESDRGILTIRVCNNGDAELVARTYGTPGYRLIAKLHRGGAQIADRWLQLPGDLAPGSESSLLWPVTSSAGKATLTLQHAAEGLPQLETEPWFSREVDLVR